MVQRQSDGCSRKSAMKSVLRSVLGIVLGILAAFIFFVAAEFAAFKVSPLPPDLDWNDGEAVSEAMKNVSTGAMLLVVLGYTFGTFAGAWVAAKVAGRTRVAHGMVIGVLFLLAFIGDLWTWPHPCGSRLRVWRSSCPQPTPAPNWLLVEERNPGGTAINSQQS
jgi:hypothetical protein